MASLRAEFVETADRFGAKLIIEGARNIGFDADRVEYRTLPNIAAHTPEQMDEARKILMAIVHLINGTS